MNRPLAIAQRYRGFSLVELITAIAILGVLAALVIPAIVPDFEGSKKVKSQKNARTIIELATSLRSAGVSEVDATGTPEAAVRKLISGVQGRGILHNAFFKLPEMSDAEIVNSLEFIEMRNGQLCLKSEGSGAGAPGPNLAQTVVTR